MRGSAGNSLTLLWLHKGTQGIEQATMRDKQNLVVEQAKWRSRGPISKFHNIIAYIRATSQRR